MEGSFPRACSPLRGGSGGRGGLNFRGAGVQPQYQMAQQSVLQQVQQAAGAIAQRAGAIAEHGQGAYVDQAHGVKHEQQADGQFMPAQKRQKGAGGWISCQDLPRHPAQGTLSAEVRFDDADTCQQAILKMNGSLLGGNVMSVAPDPHSKDNTRLIACNLPTGIEWQEVKDHFGCCGRIAFVEVSGNKARTGEVRYDSADAARAALEQLQGSEIQGRGGGPITITMDPNSKDGTKLLVTDLPLRCGWQDLKDHFSQSGIPVAFAGINEAAGSVGEVRYSDPAHAVAAIQTLNGTILGGSPISIQPDPMSADGSKLMISGIGPSAAWQDLKDHFSTIGPVAFANTRPATMKGGGKGGKGVPMGGFQGMGGMGGMQGMGGFQGGLQGGFPGSFQQAMTHQGMGGFQGMGGMQGMGGVQVMGDVQCFGDPMGPGAIAGLQGIQMTGPAQQPMLVNVNGQMMMLMPTGVTTPGPAPGTVPGQQPMMFS